MASWSKGVGAALAALLGFGPIKGPSDISNLPKAVAFIVGVLLPAALVGGAVALGLLLRAQGLAITGLATAYLIAAVGVSWYGASTPAASRLKIVDARGTTWCRTVQNSNAGSVLLKIDGSIVIVNLTGAQQVQPMDTYPAPK
ncbi:hypothetical protein [Gordonia sputi]